MCLGESLARNTVFLFITALATWIRLGTKTFQGYSYSAISLIFCKIYIYIYLMLFTIASGFNYYWSYFSIDTFCVATLPLF